MCANVTVFLAYKTVCQFCKNGTVLYIFKTVHGYSIVLFKRNIGYDSAQKARFNGFSFSFSSRLSRPYTLVIVTVDTLSNTQMRGVFRAYVYIYVLII